MEISIKIISKKMLDGEGKLDLDEISRIFLCHGISIKSISVDSDFSGGISSPTLVIMHDEQVDDFVSSHKVFYDTESKIIDSSAVLAGEEYPVLVIPVESEIKSVLNSALEEIRKRFNLPKILMFRLFGKNGEDVNSLLLENEIKNCKVYSDGFLTDIYLNSKESSGFIEESEVQINKLFQDFIYAQSNLGLVDVARKLLENSNKKIYITDCLTYGGVIKCFGSNRVSGEVFNLLSESNFVRIDGDSKCFVDEKEFVSQMAQRNIQEKNNIIAVSLACKSSENKNEIFMAIATSKSMDIYNLMLDGNFNVLEFVENWAIFNLIKKLREKDFEN